MLGARGCAMAGQSEVGGGVVAVVGAVERLVGEAALDLDVQAERDGWVCWWTVEPEGVGAIVLECREAVEGRGAFVALGGLALSYRGEPFSDPARAAWLEAMRRRLRGAGGELEEEARTVVAAARGVAEEGRFEDPRVRTTFDGPGGKVGLICVGAAPEDLPPERFARWVRGFADEGVRSVIVDCEVLRPALAVAAVSAAVGVFGEQVSVKATAGGLSDRVLVDRLAGIGVRRWFVVVDEPALRWPIEGLVGDVSVGVRVAARTVDALADTCRRLVARAAPPRVVFESDAAYGDGGGGGLVPLPQAAKALGEALDVLGEAGVEVGALGASGFPVCAFREVARGLWWREQRADQLDRRCHTYVGACEGCRDRAVCPGVYQTYVHRFGELGVRPA